jgi:hypothetical protein
MSTTINNKRTFGKYETEQKKFCSVCQKAGKSEREYTSHFTKSVPGPKGIVICPTILFSECTFCHQRGHWANEDHCPALKEKKRMQKNMQTQVDKPVDKPVDKLVYKPVDKLVYKPTDKPVDKPVDKRFGGYGIFNEKESKPVVVDEFPPLSNVSIKKNNNSTTTMNYASMAKKEPVVSWEEPSKFTNFKVLSFKTENPKANEPFYEAVSKGIVGNFETRFEANASYSEFEQTSEYDENDDSDDEDDELYRVWKSFSKSTVSSGKSSF